jgi:hypothetical protein
MACSPMSSIVVNHRQSSSIIVNHHSSSFFIIFHLSYHDAPFDRQESSRAAHANKSNVSFRVKQKKRLLAPTRTMMSAGVLNESDTLVGTSTLVAALFFFVRLTSLAIRLPLVRAS